MTKSIICKTDSRIFLVVKVAAARWQSSCPTTAVKGTDRDDVTPVYPVKRSFSATSRHGIRQLRWACMGVCVHVLSCLLQMFVVSLTQRYAHAAAVVDTTFTCNSPHLPLRGTQPVMANHQHWCQENMRWLFLTPMTTNQQFCDRLNKLFRNSCLAPDPLLENYFDGVRPR